MNCTFCNKPCLWLGSQGSYDQAWQCVNHGARKRVTFYCNETIHEVTTIFWIHNQQIYELYFYVSYIGDTEYKDNLFRMCKGSHVKDKYNGKLIFSLPFIPNITPDNIEDKIPLYITFS